MSLVLAANGVATDLTAKIRSRIADGAPVWETAVENLPLWFAAQLGTTTVDAVFQSEHALVAILTSGKSVVRSLAVA